MNLKQLEVFIAVANSGSFSRAADLTLLTQSTVSQHISSLEREFDLKLLDRTGKGALLTQAGKLLLAHATRVVEEARKVPQALSRFRGLEEVELNIGASNIPACYMVPACISSFRLDYPGVLITLLQGDSRETLQRLKGDEVELALVGARFAEKGLAYTPLARDRIFLVVPPEHPWSGRNILPRDLLDEPLIVREPGSGTYRTLRDELYKVGLGFDNMTVSLCLGSNEAIKQAIMNNAGISFLSERSIKKECERGELSIVHVRGLEIRRNFYLAARRERSLAPAAKAFRASLLQRFGSD